MTNQKIRQMELYELKNFYKFIERDFPPNEYPPYKSLEFHLCNNIQEGLVFCDKSKDLAYAICAASHRNEYVLISQLAVFPEYRGQGVGSSFIRAMYERYVQKKAVIVEVEKPEFAENLKEEEYQKKRIEFYEKLGFYIIPDIQFSIWDIPMHLMALPLEDSLEVINQEIGEVIYEIYLSLVGKRLIHNVQFKRI